jgi:glycosyltransferase involved in cell wall biosynthesis
VRVFAVFFHPRENFTAVGGAEKRFLRVLKVWERKRLDVTIVESSPKLVSACCPAYETIEVSSPISVSSNSLFSIYFEWILWIVKACLRCPKTVKRKKHDVILAQNNTLPNLFVAYFTHVLSKLPLVVTVHHFDFNDINKEVDNASVYRVYRDAGFSKSVALLKTLTFAAMLALVKRSSMCITVSNATATFLEKNGISKQRICVSGNGVDLNQIKRIPARSKVYDGIFVGRISRDKGVFDLVRIWKHVMRQKHDAKLVLVGNGPDFSRLKDVIGSNDMSSNILLKGSCTDTELYSLMKASRIFLFPSRFEGWGLAVGEALACGLPVICYDIPALRETFGECRSVFFVPLGDISSFFKVYESVFTHRDLNTLDMISEEYIRQFRWDKVANCELVAIHNLLTSIAPND